MKNIMLRKMLNKFSLSQACDKEKIRVPTGVEPLSYRELTCGEVHM